MIWGNLFLGLGELDFLGRESELGEREGGEGRVWVWALSGRRGGGLRRGGSFFFHSGGGGGAGWGGLVLNLFINLKLVEKI